MKFGVSILALTLLAHSQAFADCFPERWKLPNKGQDCELTATFGSPVSSELWSCPKDNSGRTFFLLVGQTAQQSEGDVCFVVRKVETQN